MKPLYKIVIFALLLNGLYGCAKTAGESIADTAHQQLNAIEQSIKPECMTEATAEQIKALHGTINSQLSNCETEIKRITADKIKWETIAIMLMIMIGIYTGRKFL